MTGALESVTAAEDLTLRWVNPFDSTPGPSPRDPNPTADYDFMLWDDTVYTGVRFSYPYAVPDLTVEPLAETGILDRHLSYLSGPAIDAPPTVEAGTDALATVPLTRDYDTELGQSVVDDVHDMLLPEAEQVDRLPSGGYRFDML